MFVMPCAIVALLSLYLSFLRFGLWSLSSSIHLGPYQRVWITHFACLCLLASMLYACVSLFCSKLCHVWHPQQVHGCVVTFDAHEALFGCNQLGYITMMSVASCIPFPFPILGDALLTMLVCTTRWLSLHLYMLAYMSMHDFLLIVCHPYFNTMKLWTSDPNLHLSLADTTFCLFVCLLACFLVHLCISLALSLVIFYACHVYHVYLFYAFSYALCAFSFHYLSAGFPVFAFACMHME